MGDFRGRVYRLLVPANARGVPYGIHDSCRLE